MQNNFKLILGSLNKNVGLKFENKKSYIYRFYA